MNRKSPQALRIALLIRAMAGIAGLTVITGTHDNRRNPQSRCAKCVSAIATRA